MGDVCPNCQKPVLPTDIICWHCGYQLPRRPSASSPVKSTASSSSSPPESARIPTGAGPEDYDFRALAVYGLLTLAVILGLWLVMRSLSRQPTLVRSAGPEFGGEWVSVTDDGLRFTLSFPTDWQWIDVAARDQSELLEQVLIRQPYIPRALRPLGDTAGDVQLVGVAVGTESLEDTDPKPFVVIGRSDRLGAMEPRAALDLLDDQPLPVTDSGIDTRLAGQSQARFTILDDAYAYHCRHLFVTDEGQAGYLVAACAPQAQYGILRADLDDILNSFQLVQ